MIGTQTTTYRFGSIEYNFALRSYVMGILNVTPDSFSDGGKYNDIQRAVARGIEMVEEGADFIDVGGESTRPGSNAVSVEEELKRVIPVIQKLSDLTKIPISIDTQKASVAERALEAGAVIVNDISGFQSDLNMVDVIAQHRASVVLMHIKGSPRTMQVAPVYNNLIEEICDFLQEGIQQAERKGIVQIFVDPGIGFGKTVEHNLRIIHQLQEFHRFGYPVLIGPSRKSFIGKILNSPVDQRLEGTAAAVASSIMNGANIVRVHDVKEMKRVAQIIDSISNA